MFDGGSRGWPLLKIKTPFMRFELDLQSCQGILAVIISTVDLPWTAGHFRSAVNDPILLMVGRAAAT